MGVQFNTLLRKRRMAAGLTQAELARRARCSVAALRDLEQARRLRPRRFLLLRLADVLSLGPEEAADFCLAGRQPASSPDPGTAAELEAARGLRIEILGSLGAWGAGGHPVPLGPPRQRALLGILALSANTLVHREEISDALWAGCPPETATQLVQTYVSRLRRVLAPGLPPAVRRELLSSAGPCYRLQIPAGQLDVLDFRQLLLQARSATDPAAACAAYQRALELWRGRPLADADVPGSYPALAELAACRSGAVIEFAGAAFAAGRHELVLPYLKALTQDEPLNENAHAHLMLALAGLGQQAAALTLYGQIHRRLDEQLGVRPGRQLSEAQLRVLRQEVPPAGPAGGRGPAGTASLPAGTARRAAPGRPVIPRQLPTAGRHFTGRATELEALDRLTSLGNTVVIWAVDGMAGIGKTALAVHWAHRVAGAFRDGQLYADLRGFDPSAKPVAAAKVIRDFLEALAVPAESVPSSPDAQAGLYRSLLTGKRMLIVLDNAHDEGQVRPLLPAAPGCAVIITSRRKLPGLAMAEGADLLNLGVLPEPEAYQLLASHLGERRVERERTAAEQLTRLCGGLPLALSLFAARAASRPGFPLAAMAAELEDSGSRLSVLDSAHPTGGLRSALSWSYERLPPEVARLFRLLGIQPAPDITASAAASLAAVPLAQAMAALNELASLNLVTEHRPGRFLMHDLVRTYAVGLARADEGGAGCGAAVRRSLDHYLHTAYDAALKLNSGRVPICLEHPSAGVAAEPIDGPDEALAWFKAEHGSLRAAIAEAVRTGADVHAWQLPWTLVNYLDRQGHWHELADAQRTALAAASRVGDEHAQLSAHRYCAAAQIRLGEYDTAQEHLAEALAASRRLGDLLSEAYCYHDIDYVLQMQERYLEASESGERALDLFRRAGWPAGQVSALVSLADSATATGHPEAAIGYGELALALQRELGDRYREASTLNSIARARRQLAQYDLAVAEHRRSDEILRAIGDRLNQAMVLVDLGETYQRMKDFRAAARALREALATLQDLQHPSAAAVEAKLAAIAGSG